MKLLKYTDLAHGNIILQSAFKNIKHGIIYIFFNITILQFLFIDPYYVTYFTCQVNFWHGDAFPLMDSYFAIQIFDLLKF